MISRWKIWSIIGVCLLGILFALPNVLSSKYTHYLPSWAQSQVNLGLDLRGGSHIQLEVDLEEAQKEYLAQVMDEARVYLRRGKLNGFTSKLVDYAVVITMKDPQDTQPALDILKKMSGATNNLLGSNDTELNVSTDSEGAIGIEMSKKALQQRNKAIVEQCIEVVRRRIDNMGTKEPLIQRQGDRFIIVQLPGVEDPQEIKNLIGTTAKLTFHEVNYDAMPVPVKEDGKPAKMPPAGTIYVPYKDSEGQYLALRKHAAMTGDMLTNASVAFPQGLPAISLKFNKIGSDKFYRLSKANLDKLFAIVLDNEIISAPKFQSVITDGNAQISSDRGFDIKEANDLVLLLRSGSLPAPLKIIEEKIVGPSLGADSVEDGKRATVLAVILVGIFMLLSYSLFGFFADIALVFNLTFLIACLSLLQATLTLPGIAGIALTVGMAVDANVLIYERIKEELRNGLKPFAAIEAGYRRAITTIVDSNLTNLLGAAVLFEFGSGPVRGFAVTLALGLLISMFTAISLTRLIIIKWFQFKRPETLPI